MAFENLRNPSTLPRFPDQLTTVTTVKNVRLALESPRSPPVPGP
jgi:hypothetical protein